MELRKYFYKSYHSKPKKKLKKILDDDLFFKRSLILKMALNKNIKINTNYRIERIKTEKNISNSKKDDITDDSFENKRYEEIQRKKNLLIELENILENNARKTEKFVESFKDLKEENHKFITGYDDIKIPVEERIKKFIINTMKIFQDNDIEINFMSKSNKNNLKESNIDELNDLWAQNRAAVKLFKQCPLTLKDEKSIYFYYISNYLGEKLNVNEHKYIKYMNQIKEYLDDIKNDKTTEIPLLKKERENTKHRSNTFSEKKLMKKNIEQSQKQSLIQKKKIPFNHVESSKIILDVTHKLKNKKNNKNNKNKNNEINYGSKINKSLDIISFNHSKIDSKNKSASRNNINSTQELPSKDTVNLPAISNYENKINFTNIYNLYKNNVNNKINDISCKTPKNYNLSHIRNNINMKNQVYLNTCNNKNNNYKQIEELKTEVDLNKCKSTKKFNYTFNNYNKNSFQDTNYSSKRIPSQNLSNIKKNTLSKKSIKKQINNFENLLSRNANKRSTMNLVRYINDIKLNDRKNNIIDMLKIKESKIHNTKSSKHLDQLKIIEEKEKPLSPIKRKSDNYILINLYEKAKKNNNLLKDKNLNEINEYLKGKGLNNNDILKGMEFNSDDAFVNLKSQTNKLNIEAKTKAFFHGIIPNERKKKLDQLNDLNIKINQIERDYIKTLIDKDLKFKK
jgi:hypothetical protein